MLCEKLEVDLKEVQKKFDEKVEENKQMREEKQNMEKERQGYEYKIKKLKEELEVAHIVK